MPLATLSIDLEARLARLEGDLNRAQQLSAKATGAIGKQWSALSDTAAKFGRLLAVGGAAAGLVELTNRTTRVLDAMKDAAEVTGTTVENFSALSDIAARAGTDLGSVEDVLIRFNAALLKGGEDNKGVGAVLKALNLSADELRRLDPGEALQRVAQALGGVRNDGERARAVYVLFGKSVKEAAPFLNDLAEAGRLSATATTEQAEAAEKFNKNIRTMMVNLENASRSIIGDFLPALNSMFTTLDKNEQLRKAGNFDRLGKLRQDSEATSREITRVTDNILRMNEELQRVQQRGGDDAFLSTRIEKARQRVAALQRQAAETRRAIDGITANASPLANRTAGNDFGLGSGPAEKLVLQVQEETDKLRAKLKAEPIIVPFEVQSLAPSGLAPGQIAALERVQRLVQGMEGDRGTSLDAEIEALNRLIAAGVPNAEAFAGLLGRLRRERAELNAQAMGPVLPAGMADELAELQALADNTESARRDRLLRQLDGLNRLIAEGADVSGRFAEAGAAIRLELAGVAEQVQETVQEVDRFAQEFERNVQSALGDTLVNIAKGNFDNIADAWGDMLLRMAAEAASADIVRSLFGNQAGGGAASFFANLFGAAATGGVTGAGGGSGIRFDGTLGAGGGWGDVVALSQGGGLSKSLGSGGAPVTNNYYVAAGVQRNELVQALETVTKRTQQDTQQQLRRLGVG